MSLTPLSVTGSGRWLLVGLDTGGVPTEISSPVCTCPFYPKNPISKFTGPQCCTEEEASVIVLQIVSSFFVPSMALTVRVGTAFSMFSAFHQIGCRGRRSSSSDGGP